MVSLMPKSHSEEELLRFIDYLHERLTDGNIQKGELDDLLQPSQKAESM